MNVNLAQNYTSEQYEMCFASRGQTLICNVLYERLKHQFLGRQAKCL